MKPTYGRVSRYGVIAFASSLDQVGPFAKDVEDAAVLLGTIAGADPMDSTAVDVPVPDYRAALGQGIEGLQIGVPAEYFVDGMDPEVERAVREAIAALEKLGARTEPVSLPHTEYGLAAYYVIAPAEASSNLARYDGVKYGLRAPGARDLIDMYSKTRAAGFGNEVKRRIMLGTYVLSAGYYDAYYGQAQKVRTLVRRDFEQAFARVDLIVAPDHARRGVQDGREGRPAADVPERHLHDPGEPRGAARRLDPGRLHRRPACRSGCSSSAAPSTRRRCCARPTPTSRSPPGTRASPR